MNYTKKWISYLDSTGETFNLLLPLMYVFGAMVTLLIDFVDYTIKTNRDVRPQWTFPRSAWLQSLVYTIAPLSYLGKLLHDTFKPFKYKFSFEFNRSIKQPFEGMAFILTGIWRIITSPVIAILKIVLESFITIGRPATASTFFERIFHHAVKGSADFVNGLARIVAGAIELALTPFTLLVKPVIRFAIGTMLDQNGKPNIIENNGIKSRLEIAQTQTADNALLTYADIHRKFLKSLKRGEQVDPALIDEEAKYYTNLASYKNSDPLLALVKPRVLDEFKALEKQYLSVFFNAKAKSTTPSVSPLDEAHLAMSQTI